MNNSPFLVNTPLVVPNANVDYTKLKEIENRKKSLIFIRDNTTKHFFQTMIRTSMGIEGFVSPIQYEDSQRFLQIQNQAEVRDRTIRWGFIFALFGGEFLIARRSLAFRLTQTNSLGRFVMKLMVIPSLATFAVNMLLFNSRKNQELSDIMGKYDVKSPEFDLAIQRIAESDKEITAY